MTTTQYLAALRRRLKDADSDTEIYTDTELLDATEDTRRNLEVRRILGFNLLTVDSDPTSATLGFATEPTTEQAQILLVGTLVELLDVTYRDKVDRGVLGGSWTSGLESESTISQAKAYETALGRLRSEFDELLIIATPRSITARVQ